MKREKHIVLCGAACLLALVGCSNQTRPVPFDVNSITPEIRPMQLPIRVIIYFQHAVSDGRPYAAAIAGACGCKPVFLRQYADDALIYQLALPQGENLASFANRLMSKAELGVRLVEQDRLMMHQ